MKTTALVAAGFVLLSLTAGTTTTALVDLDGDGTLVVTELHAGSDPLDWDSDGDGLSDGFEIKESGTDPTVADTDGDGLSDRIEVNSRTDPTAADTDEDGVGDGRERAQYGTDPTHEDTDRDGLEDGEEIYLTGILPDSDPTRADIYVEVDYMEPPGLTAEEIAALEQTFAEAPVQNPDGSEGISLHVVMGSEVPTVSPVALSAATDNQTDVSEYAEDMGYFDHLNQGYQYALIVEEATMDGQTVSGAAKVGETSFIVHQRRWMDHSTGSTFMHELGHSVGLSHHPDGPSAPVFECYPSTMSYNKPDDYYGFASGTSSADDIDEWGIIMETLPDSIPPTTALPEPEPAE